jgi:hypothetical protein
MRFTKERDLMEDYYNNTKKGKNKFLWLPMTIRGETRWLETADILYVVKREDTVFFGICYYWTPHEFINK